MYRRNCILCKRQEKNSVLQGKTQKFSQKLNASEPRSTHRFQSDAKKKPDLLTGGYIVEGKIIAKCNKLSSAKNQRLDQFVSS